MAKTTYKCNFVFNVVKGKVFELESTTGEGFDNDTILEKHHNTISSLIEQMKEVKKSNKKTVYLCDMDATYTIGGKFKGEVELNMIDKEMTPAEFRKLDKKLKAEDKKALESMKNMDEPDYN